MTTIIKCCTAAVIAILFFHLVPLSFELLSSGAMANAWVRVAASLQSMTEIAPVVEDEVSKFKAKCLNIDIDEKHTSWHYQSGSPGVKATFCSFEVVAVTKEFFPTLLSLRSNPRQLTDMVEGWLFQEWSEGSEQSESRHAAMVLCNFLNLLGQALSMRKAADHIYGNGPGGLSLSQWVEEELHVRSIVEYDGQYYTVHESGWWDLVTVKAIS